MESITYFENKKMILKSKFKILAMGAAIWIIYLILYFTTKDTSSILIASVFILAVIVSIVILLELILTPLQIKMHNKIITLGKEELIIFFKEQKNQVGYSVKYDNIEKITIKNIGQKNSNVLIFLKNSALFLNQLSPAAYVLATQSLNHSGAYIAISCEFLSISERELVAQIKQYIHSK